MIYETEISEIPALHIQEIAIHQEFLWLLSETGQTWETGRLFSLNIRDLTRTEIHPDYGHIAAFCNAGKYGEILATTSNELWSWTPGGPELLSTIPLPGLPPEDFQNKIVFTRDRPTKTRIIRIVAGRDSVCLITPYSLLTYDLYDGLWKITPLQQFFTKGIQNPAIITPSGSCYVGTNFGEWGGNLVRINAESGEITSLFHGTPVTGVIIDPLDTTNVLFSLGLWHMGISDGGIYRTREGRIEPVLDDEAVFDLKEKNGVFWGATLKNIREFSKEGETIVEYGKPLGMTDGIIYHPKRELVIVKTSINGSVALCGGTPIIAVQ